MIWQIVKKQLLILWRNPQQLLLLIGLPIILIAILGTALGSIMDGQSPKIQVKIAMIEHVDEKQQVEQFIKDLDKTEIPEEQIEIIKNVVSGMTPITILRDSVFGNEELKDMIEMVDVQESEKEKILKDDSYTAVIEVPENFTYEMLEAMVLNKGTQPQLLVYQNEGSQIGSSVVDSILTQYQEQFTLQIYLGQNGIDSNLISMDEKMVPGETTTINQKEPVSTKSYYGVGMAVMNVLFVASAISGVAFLEKKSYVFDRVILANVSRWVYFFGVFISGAILALLQLLIIFGFSWLVFGVSWPKVTSFMVVTVAMAISVGGISVLLTAISYRLNSEIISNFFSSVLVTLMSFLGGSFFPIGDISKLIQILGNVTPNGAGMSAYLSLLRGDGLAEISGYVLFLILFAVGSIVIAALSFPKGGSRMIGILIAKCRMFARNPWTFVIMSVMSIGFAFLLGGSHQENSIQVPIVVEHEAIFDSVVGETINESEVFVFNRISKDELTDRIENGKAEVGVIFREHDFQMMVGVDTSNVTMLKQTIQDAYIEKKQSEKIIEVASTKLGIEKEAVEEELDEVMETPIFDIEKSNFRGSDTIIYNSTFQSLFGFSLFFVIYTIAYNVLPILIEKKEGIWDRMILSPVKKWEMYVANFIYSFVTGYVQVLIIFFIFRYFVGVDYNGQFMEACLLLLPYVFSIVSLSILLTALVKNVQQFNAVIPIVSVSLAMIGGAYWPLELVESPILLFLAKLNPITYGMEILKGVAIYGYSFQELIFPISILLLMGIVMTGIGIHLMERRHV